MPWPRGTEEHRADASPHLLQSSPSDMIISGEGKQAGAGLCEAMAVLLRWPSPRTSTSSSDSSESERVPEGTFRRRLYIPGSKYGEHAYGHREYSDSAGRATHVDTATMHGTTRHVADTQSTSLLPAIADRRHQSYAFRSPWGGLCEFSTGATGTAAGGPSRVHTRAKELVHDGLQHGETAVDHTQAILHSRPPANTTHIHGQIAAGTERG